MAIGALECVFLHILLKTIQKSTESSHIEDPNTNYPSSEVWKGVRGEWHEKESRMTNVDMIFKVEKK